jgi:lysophospholipase L1-like esterase
MHSGKCQRGLAGEVDGASIPASPLLFMTRPFLHALRLLLLASALTVLHAAQEPNKFEKDIVAFEAADRAAPPPKGAILFAGDSQFTRWKTIHEDLKGYTVINRGFGGSKMSDLLHYTDRIVIPYRPRLIVVNEGGNDIHGGRTPEDLLADCKAFVTKVQQALPNTRIALSGLQPSPARWAEADTRRRFNVMLREYVATQKNVVYIDLFDAYLGADGKPREELFVADMTHHSAAGYAVRMRVMKPVLGEPR